MKHYNASDIARLCHYPQLIVMLRAIFLEEIEMPLRQHLRVNVDDALLIMPAISHECYFGVKLATVFPGNPSHGKETIQGIYCLFDSACGTLLATFDAAELTARRTAAATALAASYLSRPNSRCLGILGSGKLPAYFVAAYQVVRPIEQICLWARSSDKAIQCAQQLAQKYAFPVITADSIEQVFSCSDIVTSLTSAMSPHIKPSYLKPGLHIDLVGAHTPAMSEAEPSCFQLARVFVDTREGTAIEAGDLIDAINAGALSREGIEAEFRELVQAEPPLRRDDSDITLFKSVGIATEDLAAAALTYELGVGAGMV